MLSLSFPRGFGLLVFVLPTYRHKPKNKNKPPLLSCPPLNRDLLADAKDLQSRGHQIAAAMTARVEIERNLTQCVVLFDEFGKHWRGIHDSASWLRKRHLMRLRNYQLVIAANVTGNKAAHGQPVSDKELIGMYSAIDGLRSLQAKLATAKGGAA